MKKITLLIALFAIAVFANAQTSEDGRDGDNTPGPVLQKQVKPKAEKPFYSDQDQPSQAKDELLYDDVLIFNSLGVGIDVLDGMDFGYSTIFLKENNVQIKFDDTSDESSAFSSNDWSLKANSIEVDGDSYFELVDETAVVSPWRVMAGAPTYSFLLSENGNLGLGDQDPYLKLHLNDDDTPAIRLEQNDDFGWQPYVWDVAANETSFFIRDVTNSNNLVFRLMSGAPANSIYVTNTGNVSLGNTDPAVKLDVEGHIALDSTLMLAPQTQFPATFAEGSLLMDGNDHQLKCYNGTEWKAVSENTDNQDLLSATLTGTVLDIEIDNGASVSVDLQPLIADLEARVTALEDELIGKSSAEYNSARLFQNAPNPYSNHTVIPFYIPETISNARLILTNVQGNIVDEIMIYARGNGSLEFDQSDLESGTYFYTLIIDSKQLESKVMVKVD
ncbi:MAG: T9SS type A sorting domain-containing protein [Bacteroidales bacterium]|jgi:hypothetical protein|nr:T9SS type A sorting domain-containing protein [Bacteroidales bacterium]